MSEPKDKNKFVYDEEDVDSLEFEDPEEGEGGEGGEDLEDEVEPDEDE